MTEYISQIYNSGLGWFNDIFEVDVFVESESETYSSIPQFVRNNPFPPVDESETVRVSTRAARGDEDDDEEDEDRVPPTEAELAQRSDGKYVTNFVPLVASGIPITGFVRITSPAGRSVPYGAVSMKLASHMYAAEDVANRDIYEEEIQLCGPGELLGTMDVPYAFLGPAQEPLDESFEGSLFSVRHSIELTVARPWYTFPVKATVPVQVQRVHSLDAVLPHLAADQSDPLETAPMHPLMTDLVKDVEGGVAGLLRPQSLAITGVEGCMGGAVLSLDRALYELGETISGNLVIRGATVPIVLLKLALVRLESADGESADTTIFDESIVDARRWRVRKEGREALAKLHALHLARETANAAKRAERIAAGLPAEEEEEMAVRSRRRRQEDEEVDEDDEDDEDGEDEDGTGTIDVQTPHIPLAAPAGPLIAVVADPVTSTSGGGGGGGLIVEGGAISVDTEAVPSADAAAATLYIPTEEDLSDPVPDPDLPLLGDVTMAVDLELPQIAGLTPTYVIPLGNGSTSDGDDKEGGEASVRYYIRVTAYSAFTPTARHWAAQEVVLVRGGLQGQVTPPWRRPPHPVQGVEDGRASAPSAASGSVQFPAPLAEGLAGSATRRVGGAGRAGGPADLADAEAGLVQGGFAMAQAMTRPVTLSPIGTQAGAGPHVGVGVGSLSPTPVTPSGSARAGPTQSLQSPMAVSLSPRPLSEADVAALRRKQ